MKHLLLFPIVCIGISCTDKQKKPVATQLAIDEMVDIRIYAYDNVRFNGTMISESSLISHIAGLNPFKLTRAGIIIDENATSRLVNKVHHSLHRKKLRRFILTH